MCGICGLLTFDGRPVDPRTVQAMTDTLRHRGPDDSGIFVDGGVGLGHTRLSILDLTSAGHQPMIDESGDLVVVFNGEIYNYPDLRRELLSEGARLRSHCDTEVLLHLYRTHGTACPRYLRGMFAFVVWDRRTRTLFAARDRIGIKPFYYYLDDRRFAFASEIKAICEVPDLDRRISLDAVSTFFAYGHSCAPQTIYERIRKLPPGCSAVIDGQGCRVERYWDLDGREDRAAGPVEHARRVATLMAGSVDAHMLADVPVGVFLSGGIDSSVIAALAARRGETVRTFSIGFDAGGDYDELDAARAVARHIGSEHHELVVQAGHVPDLLERLVWHYDEPFADAAAMPTYLLSKFARESVTVALSGDGGDELYGGYQRYVMQLLSEHGAWVHAVAPPGSRVRRIVEARTGLRRLKKALAAFDLTDHRRRYAHWLTSFTSDMRQALFAGALRERDAGFDAAGLYVAGMRGGAGLNDLLLMDLRTWLPDAYLEKVDKASMAVGLEVRVPFLDHPVVEHAFTIPGGLKLSRLRKKFLLKSVAAALLPQQILARPKHGFAVPLDQWFRGELLGYVKAVLLDGRVARRGYFDVAALERMIERHVARQDDSGDELWQLLNFELWHRRFVD